MGLLSNLSRKAVICPLAALAVSLSYFLTISHDSKSESQGHPHKTHENVPQQTLEQKLSRELKAKFGRDTEWCVKFVGTEPRIILLGDFHACSSEGKDYPSIIKIISE